VAELFGLWSYAHSTSGENGPQLEALRGKLQGELQIQSGRDVVLRPLELTWSPGRARTIMTPSNDLTRDFDFIVPITTPGYLRDDACIFSIAPFLAKERNGKLPLVFPIHWVTTQSRDDPGAVINIQDKNRSISISLFNYFLESQQTDFREFRFTSPEDPAFARRIAELASIICERFTEVPATRSPPNRAHADNGIPYPSATLIELPEEPAEQVPEAASLGRSPRSRRYRTAAGRVIVQNAAQIELQTASLTLLIDEKLATLRAERPNSREAQKRRDDQIADYERLKAQLEQLRTAAGAFSKAPKKERAAVEATKTFAEGVRSWWTKSHQRICERAFDMGLFLSAVGICSIAGAGGTLGVVISGALVGGKPVIEAVKALGRTMPKSVVGA
jgi:hypothetical protein